jgi:hypothetical protein
LKIILIGYPGSQQLLPASKYLTTKYLPDFDIHYLNWAGDIEGWSNFIATYLTHLDDEKIIFALDDYLINGFDKEKFREALKLEPCVKLCESTLQEHKEYPVTTQFTIWNREELIDLLSKTTTPWDFEINGSKLFKGKSNLLTCIHYDAHSALSSRWKGVNWSEVKQEDLEVIQNI